MNRRQSGSLLPQSTFQTFAGASIPRVKSDHLLERGDGAVQVPLGVQCGAQVEVGIGVLRVEGERLLVRGNGAVPVPLVLQ